MTPLWPDASRISTLKFSVGFPGPGLRFLLAAGLFAVGLGIFTLADGAFAALGLVCALLGHVPLWVRWQSTAPGGATPAHEEMWAPVEDEWLTRVLDLERRGERWDTTPWDITNKKGFFTLLMVLGAIDACAIVLDLIFNAGAFNHAFYAGPALLVPLWLNGMRTVWNPSELRKKGEALAVARAAAAGLERHEFDVVPLLALRKGRRGNYPVDARLMLRPTRDDASGFLGVQIQVALNNVRGTDYPYLYAVILGKGKFQLPEQTPMNQTVRGTALVFERGKGQGARYLVVRQHADTSGGWHTEPFQIGVIVTEALKTARTLWRASGGEPAP